MRIVRKKKPIWRAGGFYPTYEGKTWSYFHESSIWPNSLIFHCDHRVTQDIIEKASKHQDVDKLEFKVHDSARIWPFFAESLDLSPFSRCETLTEVRIDDVYGPIDLKPLSFIKTLNITYNHGTLLEGIEYEDGNTEYFQNRVVFPESDHLETVVVHGGVEHDRKTLAEYPRLRELTIEYLKDTDLSWLSGSKSLEILKLLHTLPDNTILPELISLKELLVGFSLRPRTRSRGGKSLKTLDLSPLSVSKGLEEVRIYNQKIEDIDLSPLALCKNLKSLLIAGCALTSVDVSPLSRVPLESLTLSSNRMHSIILPELPQLKDLGLNRNSFQRIDLSFISDSKNLTALGVENNQLIELDLSPLSGLSNLRYLDLRNNRFEVLDLSPLKGIDGLHIDLNKNKHLKEVDVTPLLDEPDSVVISARWMKLIASEEKKDCFESTGSRRKLKYMKRKIEWY